MGDNQENITTIIVTVTIFITTFGFVSLWTFFKMVEREKKLLLQQQLMASRFREELLRSVMEMQEHTFQSVSREIHDNVGQLLSLAKLNLNNLFDEMGRNEKLLAVKDLVARAIEELREIGNAYNADPVLQSGLVAAIRYQAEQLKRTGHYTISFLCEADDIPVPRNHTILLYRVIQEAFNNIIRHAGASEISISIIKRDDRPVIIISDNGKGFDRYATGFREGIGLKSMQERVAMAGAALEISSAAGKGTNVIITLNNLL